MQPTSFRKKSIAYLPHLMPIAGGLDSESVVSEPTTNALEPQPAACRPFRLSDAMILIAGLAIVFARGGYLLTLFAGHFMQVCRTLMPLMLNEDVRGAWPELLRMIRFPLRQCVGYGFQFSSMIFGSMMPIFLILRLRRPRPPWRALILQPGVVAAVAMVFGGFWVYGWMQIVAPDRLDSFTGPWIVDGATVTAAWVVLALSRRWNSEPGWIDRLGRILGVTAIGTALLCLAVYWI